MKCLNIPESSTSPTMFGQDVGVYSGSIGFYKGRGGGIFRPAEQESQVCSLNIPTLTMPLPDGQDPVNLEGDGLYLMPTTA